MLEIELETEQRLARPRARMVGDLAQHSETAEVAAKSRGAGHNEVQVDAERGAG